MQAPWPLNASPPVAFDIMVFIGSGFMLVILWSWLFCAWWRRRALPKLALVSGRICSLRGAGLAIVALWCGWIVTEVGRQPWIVYQKLRTADAVTGTRAGSGSPSRPPWSCTRHSG